MLPKLWVKLGGGGIGGSVTTFGIVTPTQSHAELPLIHISQQVSHSLTVLCFVLIDACPVWAIPPSTSLLLKQCEAPLQNISSL